MNNGTGTQMATKLTQAQMAARIQELEDKIAKAAAAKQKPITFKVTAPKLVDGKLVGTTGALSVYGLQRFPITLYKQQWKRFIAEVKNLEAFMAAHDAELVDKQD